VTGSDPVAALAAQLEELCGQLARVQAEAARANARLDTEGAGGSLTAMTQVKRLAEHLDEAIKARKLKPPPAPWWGGLSDGEFRAQMAALREWVETFLRPHYRDYMTRLPDCWANHPEAVWELSTLRAEWERVYGDEDNRDLAGALAWHDRYLPGVLGRLSGAIRCSVAGCQLARSRPV
jgi:hypothetical protein